MKTVHIAIGNSDNRLTQERWSRYIDQVDRLVRDYATQVHGQWFSAPDSQYQNAAWTALMQDEIVDRFRHWLSTSARNFDQDSIALLVGETEMVLPTLEYRNQIGQDRYSISVDPTSSL